jgi:hypothetical protein
MLCPPCVGLRAEAVTGMAPLLGCLEWFLMLPGVLGGGFATLDEATWEFGKYESLLAIGGRG